MVHFILVAPAMELNGPLKCTANPSKETAISAAREADRVSMDCTIKVNIVLESGVTITGTVTVNGLTVWQCTKLKAAILLRQLF